MTDLLTPSNIMFAIGIIGLIFTIWNKVKDPQTYLDKRTAVEREEVEGQATLLAQQLNWEKESNEKRFAEMSARLTESITLAQNHIHTVDVKADKVLEGLNSLSLRVTELSTIINERIPKK